MDNANDAGIRLLTQCNYSQAVKHFAALLLHKDEADSWNGWASAHAGMGNWAEALEGFRRANDKEPGNEVVLANLETIRGILAHSRAEAATCLSETDKSVHQLAIARFRNGKVNDATRLLRELLSVTETSQLWNDLGTAHVAAGSAIDADVAYHRALELDGENRRAVTNMVLLLEGMNREEQATEWRLRVPPADMIKARLQAQPCTNEAQVREALVCELKKEIAQLPSYSAEMPAYMVAALSVNRADSSYFVARCRELLENFNDDCTLEVARSMAATDYRMYLVLAKYNLDRGDYETALPLIQAGFDVNPADLYADRLHDQCVQRLAGNENATEEFLATRFCGEPWRHFEISGDGYVFPCCPGWLPLSMGKIDEGTPEEIWNSPAAQEIRASILDGSFRYCSRTHCPKISNRNLAPKPLVQIQQSSGEVTYAHQALQAPETVALAYDKTCNLACPQCRTDFFFANSKERSVMDSYVPPILELAANSKILYLNGAGEVFGSRHTRDLLARFTREAFPSLRFHFVTNANLFDRRTYEHFDLRRRIHQVDISIDAATSETYSIVRRGGDFERLLANLRFLDDLRLHEGEDFRIELRYVVSGPNYVEMPAFVRLSRTLHAEQVCFTRFRSWGTFTQEQFNAMNIADPSHPEHPQFLKILESPEMSDPIVDLGSVAPFLSPEKGAANYELAGVI